jgi:hypothetical protein
MPYTVTIITALGRTVERSVATLDAVRHTINTTHMARQVAVVNSATGEHLSPHDIEALVYETELV